jgi:hypothetical protein
MGARNEIFKYLYKQLPTSRLLVETSLVNVLHLHAQQVNILVSQCYGARALKLSL